MQEEKDKKHGTPGSSNDDATSQETLSDVEKSEVPSEPDDGGSDLHSPDGAVHPDDEEPKTDDGVDPM